MKVEVMNERISPPLVAVLDALRYRTSVTAFNVLDLV